MGGSLFLSLICVPRDRDLVLINLEMTVCSFIVSAVSRLHRKLIYTNEHQKCLLESHEKHVESKTLELVALKAAISQRRDSLASKSHETVNRESALERELRMVRLD